MMLYGGRMWWAWSARVEAWKHIGRKGMPLGIVCMLSSEYSEKIYKSEIDVRYLPSIRSSVVNGTLFGGALGRHVWLHFRMH